MYRKFLKPVLYALCLIIPFSLIFFKPKTFNASPVLDVGAGPIGFFQSTVFEFKKLFYYRDTYEQYVKLRNQTDLLKARVVRLEEKLKEIARLDQIAEFRKSQNFISTKANVIGRDPSNWNASLILDQGAADGIKVGMPLVSPLGVVGRVSEVGRSTSKGVLVSDPNFSVAGLISRTRESGLLTGTLQGICRLKYLTENADVKVGDRVVTSKLSTAFPEGILIGVVVDVQAAVNAHAVECLVQPSVNLSQLEEVLIIKK